MVTNWATSFLHYKNRGFRWFLVLSYQFVFFLFPDICQFSKNSLFQKEGAKIGFFNFQCFSLNFEKSLFLVCKNAIKIGVSAIFGVFCCWKRRNRQKKKDNCNLWILVFFGPNISWRTSAFQKTKLPETPIFIVFFGCALFGPRCQKSKLWKASKKKGKTWLITEKLFFGIFAVFFCCFFSLVFFLCVFVFCFFFEGLRVRWGGPKGHLTWP